MTTSKKKAVRKKPTAKKTTPKKKVISKKSHAKEKGKPRKNSRPENIADAISMFVSQIESLSKALEPTIQTLEKNLKKHAEQFMKFVVESGTKKRGRSGKKHSILKSKDIPKLQRLTKDMHTASLAVRNVPITFIVALVSHFDAFQGNLLRTVFYMKPEMLNTSQKGLTFEDLVSFSSIQAARDSVIEREIDSVIRESHSVHFDWMEQRFGIPLRKDLPIWTTFIELTERRNLFVHCDGIVSRQYIEICKKHGVTFEKEPNVGEQLDVDSDYFDKAFSCIFEIGVKLGHVLWRKIRAVDLEEADGHLNEIAFDLLNEERYDLAKTILIFATDTLKKHASDVNRRIFVINLVIALRNLKENAECQRILAKDDWSACREDFALAVAILEDRYDDAANIMKQIGSKGIITSEKYATWPLFRQFRQSVEFLRAYKNIFRKEFVVEAEALMDAEKKQLVTASKKKPIRRSTQAANRR